MCNANQKVAVEEALAGHQILATGLVQILVCGAQEQRKWRDVGCVAVAVVHVPPAGELGGGRISLFSVNQQTGVSLLSCFDLYAELEYVEQSAVLHCFEVEDGLLALNFASLGEARVFSTNAKGFLVLQSRSPRASELPPVPKRVPADTSPRKSPSESMEQMPSVSPRTRKAPPVPGSGGSASASSSPSFGRHSGRAALESSAGLSGSRKTGNSGGGGGGGGSGGAGGSILSFFKNLGSKNKGDVSPRAVEEIVISAPESFEHRSHVGWDQQSGFDVENLPPEWKVLFKNAGLKRKDLKDAETAKFVMGHIAEQLSQEQSQQAAAPSPPSQHRNNSNNNTPPPAARRSPPPPVPSVASRRGTIGGSPQIVNETPPAPARNASPRNRDSIPVPSEAAPAPPPPANRRAAPPAVPQRGNQAPAPPPPPTPASIAVVEPDVVEESARFSAPAPPAAPAFDESFYGAPSPPAAPAHVDTSPRPSPRGQASLADQLGTVKLKKVDVDALKQGALPKLDQKTCDGLAGSLAMALANRRGAIAPNAADTQSDEDDDWD